jgi:hypothetical protein
VKVNVFGGVFAQLVINVMQQLNVENFNSNFFCEEQSGM